MIMNMQRNRLIAAVFILLPLAFWSGCGKHYTDEAGASASVELSGTLSLRGGHPAPMLLLEERGGKEYLLRSSSLYEELKRLSGMAVALKGVTPVGTKAPFPVLDVESYRLMPLPGGEQPVTGLVRLRDSGCFIETEDGNELRVAGEFESVLMQYPGAKIWVIGEARAGETGMFDVKGYGIIVPSKSAP